MTTKRQNKVSKESVLCGSENIGVQGKTIIEPHAIIRGDLATIEIGLHCLIASGAVLRPPTHRVKSTLSYVPVSIGDYVTVGAGAVVEAASVGAYVTIGERAVVGKRCVLSSCVVVEKGAVLVEQTVAPPFSVWAGNPARMVGRLPDCWQAVCIDASRAYFHHFLPHPTSAGASPRTSVIAPATAAAQPSAAAGTT